MEVKVKDKGSLQTSQDTYAIIQRIFYRRHKKVDLLKEHFWTISMNRSLKVLCIELVSMGSNHQTVVAPQEVFRLPEYKSASQVVLIHNHPSGSLQPSDNDLDTTNRLIQAGLIFDIKVVDHVITTPHSYYSFMDNGLIEKLRWDNKYALTFIRDKQIAEEVKKIKREAEKHRKTFGKEKRLEGIKEGAKAEKMNIAKQMLRDGESLEKTKKYTGISAQWLGRIVSEVEKEKI